MCSFHGKLGPQTSSTWFRPCLIQKRAKPRLTSPGSLVGAAEPGQCPQAEGSSPRTRPHWAARAARFGTQSRIENPSWLHSQEPEPYTARFQPTVASCCSFRREGGFCSYTKGRVASVVPESVSSLYKKDAAWEKNQILRWGRPPPLVPAWTTMLGWPRPKRGDQSGQNYSGNLSNLLANGRLRVPGLGFWLPDMVLRCPGLTYKYYNTQSRIARKTPQAASSQPRLRR